MVIKTELIIGLNAQIAALDGTQTRIDLLKLKKSAVKHEIDVTPIDDQLSILDAGLSSADINTLTVAAEAALDGGTGGGSVSGLPINSLTPINTLDLLHITSDGTVWLKTGVIEDDIASYPDATVTDGYINSVAYTGVSFSAESQDTNLYGVDWDGTHFWLTGNDNDSVYQYDQSGVYTGFSFSVAGQDTVPRDICWDGSHLWVVGNATDTVYQYLPNGTYTGISFSVAGQDTSPQSIAWDGTHLWVTGEGNDSVYQYTPEGVYTGFSFSIAGQDTIPYGITWDGSHLWVAVGAGNVYQYTPEGTYTEVSFSIAGQSVVPQGITWDGNYFWIVYRGTKSTYQYLPTRLPDHVGMATEYTNDVGLTSYTRIK